MSMRGCGCWEDLIWSGDSGLGWGSEVDAADAGEGVTAKRRGADKQACGARSMIPSLQKKTEKQTKQKNQWQDDEPVHLLTQSCTENATSLAALVSHQHWCNMVSRKQCRSFVLERFGLNCCDYPLYYTPLCLILIMSATTLISISVLVYEACCKDNLLIFASQKVQPSIKIQLIQSTTKSISLYEYHKELFNIIVDTLPLSWQIFRLVIMGRDQIIIYPT